MVTGVAAIALTSQHVMTNCTEKYHMITNNTHTCIEVKKYIMPKYVDMSCGNRCHGDMSHDSEQYSDILCDELEFCCNEIQSNKKHNIHTIYIYTYGHL